MHEQSFYEEQLATKCELYKAILEKISAHHRICEATSGQKTNPAGDIGGIRSKGSHKIQLDWFVERRRASIRGILQTARKRWVTPSFATPLRRLHLPRCSAHYQ